MKQIVLAVLSFYKKTISPFVHSILHAMGMGGNYCIYQPTCSVYMHDAVLKYGTIRGVFMGIKRILRCNPFYKGGFDPVK